MNYRLQPRNITSVFIALIALLWFGVPSLRADRYVVPPGTPGGTNTGEFTDWSIAATNIQSAVDVAGEGETVWVTNGTYYLTSQIEISGKGVRLQSTNGMEKTFINGNYPAYSNRCLFINHGGAVVQGFTIMNGHQMQDNPANSGSLGGGVLIYSGTLRNCHITKNVSGAYGGGIQIPGTAGIYDCIISSNLATGQSGGGIYSSGTDCIFSNCVFIGNTASAPSSGGGMLLFANNATENKSHAIINCKFINNFGANGGGLEFMGANYIIRNCLFDGNVSGWGDALNTYPAGVSNTKIQNCTIVRNTGSDGIVFMAPSDVLMENCIIASNSYAVLGANTTTNINNRTDSAIVGGVNSGNITDNPSFVDYAAGNFRLAHGSPCINTGTNEDWATNAIDLDGYSRIDPVWNIVDMGCYEFVAPSHGTIITVR